VPFSEVGRDPFRNYNIPELRVYDDDNPDKLRHFEQTLTQADYLVFTSQRGYASIPRMAARFPMATKFYDLLFAGKLGFQLVGEFTSYPQLGGIVLNDDNSEEAFTVYDHAKVLVYQKVQPITAEQIAALITPPDWNAIPRFTAREAHKYKSLLLEPGDAVMQQEGGTWSEIFNPNSWVNRVPTLVWLLFVQLLGLVAFPIGFGLFRNMTDRGYALSKTFGVLLLVFLSWILAALKIAPYTRLTIGIALLLLVAAAVAIVALRRREMLAFVKERWRHLLAIEVIFFALFFAWWLVRRGNPDLWHPFMGGEKPMDFAYLNAVIKSTTFPPYDPWFAGGYLNYYYWGQVIVATLIKFTGIVPWVAYNLVLPLLFALTGVGAFTVTYHLLPERVRGAMGTRLRGWLFGLTGTAFVLILGNLGELNLIVGGLIQLGGDGFQSSIPGLASVVKAFTGLGKLIGGASLPFRQEWWYWNATRTIPETINEFPFFTFLYADLHAHLIALPFTLLALGMAVNIVRGAGERIRVAGSGDAQTPLARLWGLARDWDLGIVLGMALVVGALWPTNTWDFPTYLVIGACALAVRAYTREGRIAWQWILKVAVQTVLMAALAVLLFYPFHANYGSYYTSVEMWKGMRTKLPEFLTVYGLWLFILFAFLLDRAFGKGSGGVMGWIGRILAHRNRLPRKWSLTQALSPSFAGWWTGLVVGVAALALAAYLLAQLKFAVVAFLLPAFVVALALLFRRRSEPEERFLILLILGGLALNMAVEVIVLKGDIGRMNTVFKFYLQVWVLWGVASAVALAYLSERSLNWAKGWRRFFQIVLAFLIFSAALYPVFSTRAKINDRFDPSLGPSLDGIAYMDVGNWTENNRVNEFKYDKEAILWLLTHVEGSPVILEGHTSEYRWGSRVSIYTGLPAVVGWNWHQRQQRMLMPGGTVEGRVEDVRAMYSGWDDDTIWSLLRKYNVSLIYVGGMEKALYGEDVAAKFDRWVEQGSLEVAFSNQELTIYRMR
jgi:YYY domain-containing protein